MANKTTPRQEFPTHGLMPRGETQAAEFVRKYPQYDGRGVVAAVLDTGIDPGAKGLQVTSEGKRKVVDYIDCTGSGDVELSDVCAEELTLKGASGRTLRLNAEWKNPTGEWRVGAKRLSRLLPGEVWMSVSAERSQRFRKNAQQLTDAVLAKKGAVQDKDQGKVSEVSKSIKTKDSDTSKNLTEELDAQVDVLKTLNGAYADLGPLLDCVVFHDGEQWRAAIDVDESGDLSAAAALGAYKHTSDVGELCKRQLFYYTLNFYDEGRTLSIVTCAGSHSTHVAGILAAHHPEEPQNDGVAPGAQLLSLMIGDHRVGSMETGVGLTRAVNAIVEYGADVANMSYGEPSSSPNVGQWVQTVAQEVVRRHGCVFVSSAGNEGPALSSTGSPGGTSDGFIGVGAHVGYDQMLAEYAMYETVGDTVFTWSSRGPTPDGDRGVDVYAPGSAITSFPAYCKERLCLRNGTSMSSPNLCGVAALLVSAWKQEMGGASLSPYRVKNAIVSTAKPIGELHGAGMVQTDSAWQFLKRYAARAAEQVSWRTHVDDSRRARGIYLRNAEESAHARFFNVSVVPVFPTSEKARLEHDSDGENGRLESQTQFDFEQRLLLVATESWVSVPDALYVASQGNKFAARVDATKLQAGRLHTASIDAYDSTDVDRGPVFSIPVTVTKPLHVDASACVDLGTLQFRPTEIVRRFVAVPPGATRAHIVLRASNAAALESSPALFYLHCMQLEPATRFRKFFMRERVSIGHKSYGAGGGSAEQKETKTMDVIGGATLEVCLAQFWNQLGAHDIDVRVEFNGIVPANGGGALAEGGPLRAGITVHGSNAVARLDFIAPVRPEYDVSPSIVLTKARKTLRPHEAVISPLDAERDTHLATGSALYKLELDYRLETTREETQLCLHMPAVDTQIYENWADNFALAIFDANKRYLISQISYTSPLLIKQCGESLVRVQIRHRSAKDLEALKDIPLLVDVVLKSSIRLTTKFDMASIFTSTVSSSAAVYRGGFIAKGSRIPLFIDTIGAAVPSEAAPGDVLVGKLTMSRHTADFDFEYVVPAKSIKKPEESTPAAPKTDKPESKEEQDQREMNEALRRVRVDWVKKSRDDGVRTRLVTDLLANSNDEQRAEVLAAQLSALDATSSALPWSEAACLTAASARRAVGIADSVIELTRTQALTARLYEKAQTDDEKTLKKQAELARTQLIAALTTKCRALAALTHGSVSATASETCADYVEVDGSDNDETDASEQTVQEYERAAAELRQWAAADDVSVVIATAPLHMARHQYARALQPVLAWLAKAPMKPANAAERRSMVELRNQLLAKLQWTIWSAHFRAIAPIESPATYERL
ncbi:hypothetical protein J3B01_005055 [Coemansia erecta]|nr:hypothetical protein J3B01_005055 [Coemansia erecta]